MPIGPRLGTGANVRRDSSVEAGFFSFQRRAPKPHRSPRSSRC